MKKMKRANQKMKNVFYFNLLIALFSAQLFSESFAQESLQQGRELFGKGQFTDALSFFDKGVDEKPTDGDSHFWRAKCLSSLDRRNESIAEFKLALLLSTDETTKNACRAELKKRNESIPIGSVVSEADSKANTDSKMFKLSTKKLDWNLKVDNTLKSSLDSQNAQLASAVNGTGLSVLDAIGGRAGESARTLNSKISSEIRQSVPHAPFQLTAADLQTLKGSDVYIILDHSGSMEAKDCPSGGAPQSRLAWSIEELNGFSELLSKALPHGFVFMPFNSHPQAFKVTNSHSFSSYLRNLRSEGGTNLSPALQHAFRLHQNHLDQPLLIAIITDGLIHLHDVKRTIVDATRMFRLPNGVFVTFAQVGVSVDTTLVQSGSSAMLDQASEGLDELKDLQHSDNAAYNPCSVIRFRQLRQEGLGRAILRALRVYVPAPSEQSGLEQRKSDERSVKNKNKVEKQSAGK